ncbi:MAG: tRNA (adenosine(37)-N6)-threonylcarbamoyltransferase complex dimerization subunit type 1 TsaB [Caulobacteraceae bacterium]|nr:tRNA (adenosine(37)-N6)-threonylcarbamoyltransferase complex dimerization subunit type 1 TsaB [Caulobacteraceae bacterium]
MVLALDTCLDACSAAVLRDETVLAVLSEPMARGHQEALAPMVQAVMAEAGLGFDALDRIAVTTGPGSFTGLRVGLAFAKGLALATAKPAVGVGVLEALARSAAPSGFTAAAVDAKRGQVYLQVFIDGAPAMAPDALDLPTAAARLAELWTGAPAVLIGSGAPLLADVLPKSRVRARTAPDPLAIAAAGVAARAPFPPLRPLYLRAPDARPPQPRPRSQAGAKPTLRRP